MLAPPVLNHSAVMVAETKSHNELRLLFWETTAGCNLECIHCRCLDVSRQLMKNDLATQESLLFVRALAAFAKPILVLSGSEPLAIYCQVSPADFCKCLCARSSIG